MEAFEVIEKTRPKGTYRGAVIGCGRMGSTIDDEHVGEPCYPWPWAHAPAMIDARGVDLIAASDPERGQLDDFHRRWGTEKLYEEYREMVAEERPDLVCVDDSASAACGDRDDVGGNESTCGLRHQANVCQSAGS